MAGSFKEKAVEMGLRTVLMPLVNTYVAEYGEVTALHYVEGGVQAVFLLKGLEDRPVTVHCRNITISEDGSRIRIGAYTSNMPFLETALNRFAVNPIPVSNATVRQLLVRCKSLLS